MFFSLLGIAVAAGIQIAVGGPIPTYKYDSGSQAFFAGNVISVVFSVVCIVIIVRVIRNRIIGIVALCGILLSFVLSIYYINALGHFPGAMETSPYARDFYKADKEKGPPFLEFLQGFGMGNIGCCGGASFDDYAESTLKWNASGNNGSGYFQFDAPDSCCKSKGGSRKGCGKNLIYYLHKIDFTITHEAFLEINDARLFSTKREEVLARKLREENQTAQNPQPTAGPNRDLTAEEMANRSKENLGRIQEYDERNSEDVKIFTLGCGRIFDELNDGKLVDDFSPIMLNLPAFFITIFAIALMKLALDASTIGIYIQYYIRFNYPPLGVHPADGIAAPPGAFEGSASLSEGIGHPRIDADASNMPSNTEIKNEEEVVIAPDAEAAAPSEPPPPPPAPPAEP